MSLRGMQFDVVIASGAAVSAALNWDVLGFGGDRPTMLAVRTPAAWTAADLIFEVSDDGTVWDELARADGLLLRIAGVPTAKTRVTACPAELAPALGARLLRVRSVAVGAATDVNQGAARTLRVYTSEG